MQCPSHAHMPQQPHWYCYYAIAFLLLRYLARPRERISKRRYLQQCNYGFLNG